MAAPKLFFDSRFTDAVPVASSTAAGNFNAANVADMRPYTWWKPNALPATLTVDCGSAKSANYALIYGHDLFTQGASVEIHGSTDNFSVSDVTLATFTPVSNNPFLLEFAAASYRYWRLKITGTTYPSIAIALIGTEFLMPTYLKTGFAPVDRDLIQQANNNDNGQPLGKIIDFEQWKQTLQFGLVGWDWLRNTWQPAWRSNIRGNPILFAWNTDLYPGEIYLVSVGTSYRAPHQAGGNWADLQFDVSGVAT